MLRPNATRAAPWTAGEPPIHDPVAPPIPPEMPVTPDPPDIPPTPFPDPTPETPQVGALRSARAA